MFITALLFVSCLSDPPDAAAQYGAGEWSIVSTKNGTNYSGVGKSQSAPSFGQTGAPVGGGEGHCLAGGAYPFKAAAPQDSYTWHVEQTSATVPTWQDVGANCTGGAAPSVLVATRCDSALTPPCLLMMGGSTSAAPTTIWGAGNYDATSIYTDGTQKNIVGKLLIRPNNVGGSAGGARVETWCFNDDFYFPATAAQPKRVGGGTVNNVKMDYAMTNTTAASPLDGSGNVRPPADDCNWLDGDSDVNWTHAVRYTVVKQ